MRALSILEDGRRQRPGPKTRNDQPGRTRMKKILILSTALVGLGFAANAQVTVMS
jgi:hypothetical protein